jgi:hypothetical protein
MAIAPELRAQILRLYQAEHWRIGTIASQLHLHRDTVQRVIAQACVMRPDAPLRPSQIDAYLPFIRETLAKFPTLAASRLHAMVRERGYTGGPDHFRHLVACHRPRPAAEAYLRLRTLPGEQAQVDWGHFGHLVVGRAKRPLLAFVMVAELLAAHFPALQPERPHGQLPAWPCAGLRCLRRRGPGAALRQLEERRARARGPCQWYGHPLQRRPAGLRRRPPLRAASGGGGTRQ